MIQEEGVRVFILLYKEFEMALGLNSYYSKLVLSKTHENIKVLRHPDHAKVGVFLWAHHEKIVCVDQTYAFIGGVDLCYGRWDDFEHRLTDLGSVTPTLDVSTLKKKTSTIPGGDSFYPIPVPYCQRVQPEIKIQETEEENSDSDDSEVQLPQLEPGDHLLIPNAAEHLKMNTPEMERKYDLSVIKTKVKLKGKEILNMMYSQNEESLDEPDNSPPKKFSNGETDSDLCGSAKYWVGKDYVNFIVKDFTDLDAPLVDFIDRATTPRMPWHDIAVCVQGSSARDVARHFIQRWNATKLEKARLNLAYPFLLPKSYNISAVPDVLHLEQYKVTCQVSFFLCCYLKDVKSHNVATYPPSNNSQVLRSVSTWSCGFLEPNTTEQSIHEAYVDAINRSQHYIYIENQFFISLPHYSSSIRNQIQESLFKRIMRAHK